jgi:hypothetical protein
MLAASTTRMITVRTGFITGAPFCHSCCFGREVADYSAGLEQRFQRLGHGLNQIQSDYELLDLAVSTKRQSFVNFKETSRV